VNALYACFAEKHTEKVTSLALFGNDVWARVVAVLFAVSELLGNGAAVSSVVSLGNDVAFWSADVFALKHEERVALFDGAGSYTSVFWAALE